MDDWRHAAACVGEDPIMWDLDAGDQTTALGKQICAGCPVRVRCLQAALREATFGVVRGGEVFRNPRSRYRRCLRCGAGFVSDNKRLYCRDSCRENRVRVAA